VVFTRGALLILTPLTAVVADSVTASGGPGRALLLDRFWGIRALLLS
jgi:hypothetical protein